MGQKITPKPAGAKKTSDISRYKFSYEHLILVVLAFIAVALLIYISFSSPNSTHTASKPDSVGAAAARKPPSSSSAKIYLSPSSGNIHSGTTITVSVRENSGTTPVNAIQANISYPSDKLSLTGQDYKGSSFSIEAQNAGGAGSIEIARGSTTPVTGDQLVGNLTFQVIGTTGKIAVSFTSGTALVSSSTNANLISSLSNTFGAGYRIQ